ncbi:hypothetical protein Tco_1417950 [Tanacetum coccineum]|uniref:Uncharacterized protein n=1 Tax=Tanacetum coccineum TaxID=301880 RepID=A0ABQ5DGH8_9ASTR
MAALQYKDDHNRIAYLGRERGSEDFTDILSYLDHSPLGRLNHDPPVVFDHWAQLQLDDANGIFDMQIDDIFAGMGAIGYPPALRLEVESISVPIAHIPYLFSTGKLAIAAAGNDAADEETVPAHAVAGSPAVAHPVPHPPPFSPVRETTPERQPETEWVVPNPVSPGTDWRPWPSVLAPRPPTPPAQTLSLEEPLVFGPVPKPAGYVDPDSIDPIIFGPPPRPYDICDPALEESVIFGPLPRPANYIEPEDITNLNSMEDETILGDSMRRHMLGLMMLLHQQPMLLDSTLVGDAPATEGDVDIQDAVDLEGLSRMASEALGHDQATVPSEDIEEREEEEVPLRRKTPCQIGDPSDILAEDAQARQRLEEEQASARLVQQLQAEDLAQADVPLVSEQRAKKKMNSAA